MSPSNNRIFLSPPCMSGKELDLIKDVFDSNYIAPLGPMVDKFEANFCEYTGYSYAVALSSGTAALHLALLSIGLKPGDHVWGSDLTFIGSISSIKFCNAIPTFVDSSNEDWNIDPCLVEEGFKAAKKNGILPKAIIVTDLYGQMCNYDELNRICDDYNVMLIGDSAESLGASYKNSRSPSNIAAYSFNGNKIITTSGGGMLASNDKKLIEYARFLSQQARDPYPFYQHSVIGYNYRMSNVVAAIGVAQLSILDQRVQTKKQIYSYYHSQLAHLDGITFMPILEDREPNYWLTAILIDEKTGVEVETVRLALEKENIEARQMWKPMHMQPVFSDCKVIGGSLSKKLFKTGLCLPSGAALQQNEQDRIIEIIKKFF